MMPLWGTDHQITNFCFPSLFVQTLGLLHHNGSMAFAASSVLVETLRVLLFEGEIILLGFVLRRLNLFTHAQI